MTQTVEAADIDHLMDSLRSGSARSLARNKSRMMGAGRRNNIQVSTFSICMQVSQPGVDLEGALPVR